ncbi:PfkB family carbohydrate kinase [Leucobacter chromiisoli]|uniref:PfkB family carbohydrate kinase n=1 Tax=Leucobacter chromiisoli TaxID=2796471 RepID=UPI0035577D27
MVLSLEIPLDTALRAAEEASGAGARVLLNAAPGIRIEPRVLRWCDPLVVNEHEAREVLGAHAGAGAHASAGADGRAGSGGEGRVHAGAPAAFEELGEALRRAGARSVVITLGSEGALVLDEAGADRIPAYAVPAADTTGAGDAFVGALAAELAADRPLRDAVRFATAVSAVAVQRPGAQSSFPDRAEVETFIRGSG